MNTKPTHCEYDGSVRSFNCAREEQCDDCFMVDHLKECAWCEHYDHPAKEVEEIMEELADQESKYGEQRQ